LHARANAHTHGLMSMPTHAATRANFGTLNATKDGSQADGSAAARERARWFPPADVEPDPSLMPLRVAYQGEPGAYSEAAVHEAFKNAGRHIDACGYESFEEVFSALVDGAVDHAAVPIENTLGGSIHVNYDLMLRYHGKVHIVGEHSFRVRHMLLALPGVKKADVKKAMSHPQALSQTEGYLRHAGIKQVPAYDTAGSAKLIREQGLRDTAAIASSRAAEVHGLEVLDFGIEDECNNFTRFLFFGRTPCAMPEDTPAKTSVVFVPKKNEAGVLFKALSVFAVREVDLSKIESRPFRPGALPVAQCLVDGAPSAASLARKTSSTELAGAAFATPSFDYAFYIDFLAAATEPRAINAFRHLEEIARLVKVLGTYPIEGLALDTGETAAASEGGPSKVVHTPALAFPLRVAIIGFGTFGQFLAKLWVQRGHQVYAQSRTDYSELAEAMGATYVKTAAELVPFEVDVVVISVSILSFAKVPHATLGPGVPRPM
jgi:prephenate dehydratase